MDDNDLVDAYGTAALRAGKSNSGLCISASASSDWQSMQEFRELLKARFKALRGEIRQQQVANRPS